MKEKIPDVIFVKQNAVDDFMKKYPEYDVAQAHSGDHPYILAKKELILKKVSEELEKNPIITKDVPGKKCSILDITPLHRVDDNFREYMIKTAKENNIVYVNEKETRKYK
jgi:hypothetical protein